MRGVASRRPVGRIGVVIMSGPGAFSGYLSPEHTAAPSPAPGWSALGDLGRLDAEGYLWITGRAKDLVIRGGHNIDPLPIEELLYRHPRWRRGDRPARRLCRRTAQLAWRSLKPAGAADAVQLLGHVRAPARRSVPRCRSRCASSIHAAHRRGRFRRPKAALGSRHGPCSIRWPVPCPHPASRSGPTARMARWPVTLEGADGATCPAARIPVPWRPGRARARAIRHPASCVGLADAVGRPGSGRGSTTLALARLDPALKAMLRAELRPGEPLVWLAQPIPRRYGGASRHMVLFGIPLDRLCAVLDGRRRFTWPRGGRAGGHVPHCSGCPWC